MSRTSSLLLLAGTLSACGGSEFDPPSAEISVRVDGSTHAAWALTGPADQAIAVTDELVAALAAEGTTASGDATLSIAVGEERVDVPLAAGADTGAVQAIAEAHGFSVTPGGSQGGVKADGFGVPANRGRIARAEVANYKGWLVDSFAGFNIWTGEWTIDATDEERRWTKIRRTWGQLGDQPVLGDFDRDGRTDVTVWRPSDGRWYVWTMAGPRWSTQWGQYGDIPTPGDFDRDGMTDYAIYRPSTRTFWILESDGKQWSYQVPDNETIWPATGDFDGDGMTDLGWGMHEGRFSARLTTTNAVRVFPQTCWYGWWPIPGDYDDDGKSDPGSYQRGYFRVYQRCFEEPTGGDGTINAGSKTAIAVAGDYDGDGRMDYAVFEPDQARYTVLGYRGNSFSRVVGSGGDVPVTGYNRWDNGLIR